MSKEELQWPRRSWLPDPNQAASGSKQQDMAAANTGIEEALQVDESESRPSAEREDHIMRMTQRLGCAMKILFAIDQGLSASSKVDIELRKEILVSQESEWNRWVLTLLATGFTRVTRWFSCCSIDQESLFNYVRGQC